MYADECRVVQKSAAEAQSLACCRKSTVLLLSGRLLAAGQSGHTDGLKLQSGGARRSDGGRFETQWSRCLSDVLQDQHL